MVEKQYFLVFLGDTAENNEILRSRLVNKCHARTMMNNAFIIETIISSMKTTDIRDLILEKDLYKLIVIRLDANFSSAWYMGIESSRYMSEIFDKITFPHENNR